MHATTQSLGSTLVSSNYEDRYPRLSSVFYTVDVILGSLRLYHRMNSIDSNLDAVRLEKSPS